MVAVVPTPLTTVSSGYFSELTLHVVNNSIGPQAHNKSFQDKNKDLYERE